MTSQPTPRTNPLMLVPITQQDEQRLLGLAAESPDVASITLGELYATDFYADPHPAIFTAMRLLAKRGEPINLVSLQLELRRRNQAEAAAYAVASLVDVNPLMPSSEEVASWIKALQARRKAAEAQEAQQKALRAVESGDPEQALKAVEAMSAATRVETKLSATYVNAPPAPISAADLGRKEIEPSRYFIDGLLRTGLALFIGNPGIGKTPALVQLAIAFATGGRWLGALKCPKVKTLYIGVEYDQAYIKEVLVDSTGSTDLPDNLYIHTLETFTSPVTADDSIAMLEYYLKVMQVEVIIIDVFSGFLPRENFKQNAYRGDYAEFLAYHRLCMEYRALLVGAWHGGKHNKDPETAYNGGQGMWGSAGGGRLTMFYDDSQQVRIRSQLRGHQRMEWLLEQARMGGAHFWSVVDADPDPILGSDAQTRIYQAVKQHGTLHEPISPAGVRGILRADAPDSCPPDAYIRQTLGRLAERGIIVKLGGGYIVQKHGSPGSGGSAVTVGSGGSGGSPATPIHAGSDFSPPWIGPAVHSSAENATPIQPIHRSNGSSPDPKPSASQLAGKILIAGWTQERSDKGYRYVHPDLGATAWHRVPFHAMDEAANISAPPPDYTAPEGY